MRCCVIPNLSSIVRKSAQGRRSTGNNGKENPTSKGLTRCKVSRMQLTWSSEYRDHRPGLHMSLPMLLRLWIIELQSPKPGTGHQKEGNILHIFDILFTCVLLQRVASAVSGHWRQSGGTKRLNARERKTRLTLKMLKISVLLTTERVIHQTSWALMDSL